MEEPVKIENEREFGMSAGLSNEVKSQDLFKIKAKKNSKYANRIENKDLLKIYLFMKFSSY
jgi:hypothetical protein